MLPLEMLGALLFVTSSGILFSDKYRKNPVLVAFAAIIAIVSTITLFDSLVAAVKLPVRSSEKIITVGASNQPNNLQQAIAETIPVVPSETPKSTEGTEKAPLVQPSLPAPPTTQSQPSADILEREAEVDGSPSMADIIVQGYWGEATVRGCLMSHHFKIDGSRMFAAARSAPNEWLYVGNITGLSNRVIKLAQQGNGIVSLQSIGVYSDNHNRFWWQNGEVPAYVDYIRCE